MKTKYIFASLVLLTLFNRIAFASEKPAELKRWARAATSLDEAVSRDAFGKLRAAGPQGLQALVDEHSVLFPGNKNDPTWKKLTAAMDFVGQQRDCHASKLYWFTDFEKAKAEANTSGKPILSLRLLGKLDEEFSCANSRFFRTTLYANAEVSKFLHDNFVLHWKSVRPVPRMTIDFGDGRKIERTITGNSIHYILDASGKPIDALPGLYGPKAFISGLNRAKEMVKNTERLSGEARENFLRDYHRERLAAITIAWQDDLAKVNGSPSLTKVNAASDPFPAAAKAGNLAIGKFQVERPLLQAINLSPANFVPARTQLETQTSETSWQHIATLHAADAQLDENAKRLIQSKNATALDASRVAFTKSIAENPVLRVLRNLERSIAEDTVRNEYQLHSRLHEWFAAQNTTGDVDQLNRKVYAELFLTPDSDPWLGLAPTGSFSALENDGLVQSTR